MSETEGTEATASGRHPLVEARLRRPASAIWSLLLAHPFVVGLGTGDLPIERFRYFVAQDAVYLHDFSKVLALGAARAEPRADEAMFLRHATTVHVVEQALHADLAPRLGLRATELADTTPGPVTVAYTDRLLRAAWADAPLVLVAAVLPCYWVYRDVGRHLALRPPAHPLYQAWIETYAGAEYGQAVEEILSLAERWLATAPDAVARQAARAFWLSTRYEWWFWEQAWRLGHLSDLSPLPDEPVF
jgi:thiaminase/transcriptional activator TenA